MAETEEGGGKEPMRDPQVAIKGFEPPKAPVAPAVTPEPAARKRGRPVGWRKDQSAATKGAKPGKKRSRDELAGRVAELEAELAGYRGDAPPPPKVTEEQVAGAISKTLVMMSGMLARALKAKSAVFSQEEGDFLGATWAPIALPFAEQNMDKAPVAMALVLTASVVLPKVDVVMEERRQAVAQAKALGPAEEKVEVVK